MKPFRLLLFYFGIVLLCGIVFFVLSLTKIRQQLVEVSNRIQEDIIFENGKWDTSMYNADPFLPGTAPIYVLAADGYVIERWKPINGFLDASDFKHLLNFTTVQTIDVSTNQDWRVLSVPIQSGEDLIGVITLSYFHPLNENLAKVDRELVETAQKIKEKVHTEGDSFRIESFDQRKVPYYIAYQVVNRFNKIVFKSNNSNSVDRLPNYIDPSYIVSQLSQPSWQLIQDRKTQEFFLIKTEPLHLVGVDTPQQGVIVVGSSVSELLLLIVKYVGIMVFFGIVVFSIHHAYFFLQGYVSRMRKHAQKNILQFDRTNSQIVINEIIVPIEYASNQYYLIDAVLNSPYKRWEIDELMEKFGEELNHRSWRKIYDTMSSVNKKVFKSLEKKMILVEGKTFRLNPELIEFL